jgi:hypothetical protein
MYRDLEKCSCHCWCNMHEALMHDLYLVNPISDNTQQMIPKCRKEFYASLITMLAFSS